MITKIECARWAARLPHFRGKFHLTNYLSPRSGQIEESLEGYRITFDLADLVQRHAFMRTWEVAEVRLIKRLLRPGAIFFDVGANFGYYTAISARRVGPAGAVYAFEPEPSIFAVLSSWVYRAQIPQAHCVNLALSSEVGVLTLYVPPAAFHNHDPSVVEYCEGMKKIAVGKNTLDRFCGDLGLKHIDVLKLDVEGHENEVLAGARNTLSEGGIDWLLCEFNPEFCAQTGHSLEDLYGQICNSGFREVNYTGGPALYPSLGRGLPNRLFRSTKGTLRR